MIEKNGDGEAADRRAELARQIEEKLHALGFNTIEELHQAVLMEAGRRWFAERRQSSSP